MACFVQRFRYQKKLGSYEKRKKLMGDERRHKIQGRREERWHGKKEAEIHEAVFSLFIFIMLSSSFSFSPLLFSVLCRYFTSKRR